MCYHIHNNIPYANKQEHGGTPRNETFSEDDYRQANKPPIPWHVLTAGSIVVAYLLIYLAAFIILLCQ